jgi:hypothetical protein
MNRSKKNTGAGKTASFFLWTIRHQSFLAHHIRVYVWCAVAVILVLTLADKIALQAALEAIFFGGVFICAMIWILIERRRSWLLHIDDPVLKQTAHRVMLATIYEKLPPGHPFRNDHRKNG